MPELVEDDAGAVVPYLDVGAAADRLADLATAEETRESLGRRAAAKVADRCSIDVVGPQIAAVFDRCLQ
jgi:glycosyltransferase involved in cell wall biosynthesis